jgi:translation initiation factor 1 (eIF-1/SUI1)
LLRILDSELRLITPTEPAGVDSEAREGQAAAGERYYQLTHDYLVPSLRDWLTRKQKETRRGRAELLLADRADVWNARPANRHLPSVWDWLQIRCLTQKKNWTPAQRRMLQKAGWYHAIQSLMIAVLMAAGTFVFYSIRDITLPQMWLACAVLFGLFLMHVHLRIHQTFILQHVTTADGVPLDVTGLLELAAKVKERCGSHGIVKKGRIVFRGGQLERIVSELNNMGYRLGTKTPSVTSPVVGTLRMTVMLGGVITAAGVPLDPAELRRFAAEVKQRFGASAIATILDGVVVCQVVAVGHLNEAPSAGSRRISELEGMGYRSKYKACSMIWIPGGHTAGEP